MRQTVQNCEIDILTQDMLDYIDHIAVSKGLQEKGQQSPNGTKTNEKKSSQVLT